MDTAAADYVPKSTAAADYVPKSSGFLAEADQESLGKATPFRDFIPKPDHPRIAGISSHTALSWCESRRAIPEPGWLINRLHRDNIPPFVGFTSDGKVVEGLYNYAEDEGAPVEAMVEAAEALLARLSAEEKERTECGSLLGDEFRLSNPELYINPGGLRLDQTTPAVQDLVHALLRASSSEAGYSKILGCCLTNEFLGQLVNGAAVLNKHSYNFRIFETPSLTKPWGLTFFGHHLCLAVTIVGKRMVISPTFFAAEPDHIDEGPHEGLRLFRIEEEESLSLMVSLAPELQAKAQVYSSMTGIPDWNPFDERHVGGAMQDNRVVPYQGVQVKLFSVEQKARVMKIFEAFNEALPEGPLAARLAQIEAHLDATWMCWYGGFGPNDPYYFRLHSPVAFIELDFHCGIFLTNTSPSKCHKHMCMRAPNGADYGRALLAQYERELAAAAK